MKRPGPRRRVRATRPCPRRRPFTRRRPRSRPPPRPQTLRPRPPLLRVPVPRRPWRPRPRPLPVRAHAPRAALAPRPRSRHPASRPRPRRKPAPTPSCPADMVSLPSYLHRSLRGAQRPWRSPFSLRTAGDGEQWCAAHGKRLCSEGEWVRACQGPHGRRFPYGDEHRASACNDDRALDRRSSWKVARHAGRPGAAVAEAGRLYPGRRRAVGPDRVRLRRRCLRPDGQRGRVGSTRRPGAEARVTSTCSRDATGPAATTSRSRTACSGTRRTPAPSEPTKPGFRCAAGSAERRPAPGGARAADGERPRRPCRSVRASVARGPARLRPSRRGHEHVAVEDVTAASRPRS